MQFLESFLNEHQRLRLAVRMKGLFRAIMGNPTGFYTLDLASAQGRMTAIKVSRCGCASLSRDPFLPRSPCKSVESDTVAWCCTVV